MDNLMDNFWGKISRSEVDNHIGIQVYQTNFLAARLRSLEYNYPLVKLFLADKLFQSVARRYGEAVPSTESSLNNYGDRFPAFLREIAPYNAGFNKIPFVDQLAEIDWGFAQAYFASAAIELAPHL